MARYSKTLTPAALAGFLAALRRGVLVEAAAAQVGVAVSTLYCRRRRDPGFDSAWTAAAEASSGWAWQGRGRKRRRVRTKRRLRFGGARREAFLGRLELSCDTKNSARRGGVHPATIYRHIARDPGFERANKAALERGYQRLERESERDRARRARRIRRALDRGPSPEARPPGDLDRLIRLLDRWRRPERPRRPGAREALSVEDGLAELERKLRNLDVGIPPPRAS